MAARHARATQGGRRASVYDSTSLGLDSSGSRTPRGQQIWTGWSERDMVPAVDKRGNVIPRDAVGRSWLKRLSKRKRLDNDEDTSEIEDSLSGSAEGEALNNYKAIARAAFYKDFSWLDPPEEHHPIAQQHADLCRNYHPSSDLLKYIHFYASEIYSREGILYDTSKHGTSRKSRGKQPAVLDSDTDASSSSSSEATLSYTDPLSPSQSNASTEAAKKSAAPRKPMGAPPIPGSTQPNAPRVIKERKLQAERAKAAAKLKKAHWKKSKALHVHLSDEEDSSVANNESSEDPTELQDERPNMYRAFDGSALLCIGLLLQEHVAKQVDQSVALNLGTQSQEKVHIQLLSDSRLDYRQEDMSERFNEQLMAEDAADVYEATVMRHLR